MPPPPPPPAPTSAPYLLRCRYSATARVTHITKSTSAVKPSKMSVARVGSRPLLSPSRAKDGVEEEEEEDAPPPLSDEESPWKLFIVAFFAFFFDFVLLVLVALCHVIMWVTSAAGVE